MGVSGSFDHSSTHGWLKPQRMTKAHHPHWPCFPPHSTHDPQGTQMVVLMDPNNSRGHSSHFCFAELTVLWLYWLTRRAQRPSPSKSLKSYSQNSLEYAHLDGHCFLTKDEGISFPLTVWHLSSVKIFKLALFNFIITDFGEGTDGSGESTEFRVRRL